MRIRQSSHVSSDVAKAANVANVYKASEAQRQLRIAARPNKPDGGDWGPGRAVAPIDNGAVAQQDNVGRSVVAQYDNVDMGDMIQLRKSG